MAGSNTFLCTVITPEEAVLECQATFVAFPAHDGEMGILNHRAPLICRMGIGTLRVESPDENRLLFVDGGFAQVSRTGLTLLTEQACKASDIDASKGDADMVEAHAMKVIDDRSCEARSRAIQRAQVRLKLLRKRGGSD